MKKLLATLLLFAAMAAPAQEMRRLFIEMPAHLTPTMTENDRRDCIDFLDAGMRASVTNRLDGKSELTILTDNFLQLNTSRSSSMQIRLLPQSSGDSIICVISSVCAEACDSRISFYNKKWEKLSSTHFFTPPATEEFFHPSDSSSHYIVMADIRLVKLTLSATSDSLHAEYTMPTYMNKEDSAAIAPQLHPIRYKWDGNSFLKLPKE